jgi:hypothetical protein
MPVGMVCKWPHMVLRLDSKGQPPYAGQGELDGFRSQVLIGRRKEKSCAAGRDGVLPGQLLVLVAVVIVTTVLLATPGLRAQTCTTQAKMTPDLRNGLSDAALRLGQFIQGGDVSKVQADTIAEFANGSAFAPTAALVQATSSRLASDTLQVAQLYKLDASSRSRGDSSDASFSCPLTGTTSETDFAIPGLPPGVYGFAMVEAVGDRPWLLSFLLRQDEAGWKMAGFYPRASAAAGHDGLWYWKSARDYAKADELWLAWIFYSEADELMRPANFATSTNLDRLRSDQRAATPPELTNGIGAGNPLVVKTNGVAAEYRFTSIAAQEAEDGKQLNLVLHLRVDDLIDPTAVTARSKAAAQAMLDAHIELRQAFQNVWVFADMAGHPPLLTEQTISSIP